MRAARSFVAIVLVAGIAGATASRAGADTNLVTNGGFGFHLASWDTIGVGVFSWTATDIAGQFPSGSALLENDTPNSTLFLTQCLPVTAGQAYAFGVSAWIESGGPAGGRASIAAQFFLGPDCTGAFGALPGTSTTLTDRWVNLGRAATANAAHSVRLELEINRGVIDPGKPLRVHFDNAFYRPGGCAPSDANLCLQNGRFQVVAYWALPNHTDGIGTAVPYAGGGDSGSFWFFDPANVELDVKVLNACIPGLGNHYWFFAAGLTNVQTQIVVTDTLTGKTKVYDTAQGRVFQTITDTSAFATCP